MKGVAATSKAMLVLVLPLTLAAGTGPDLIVVDSTGAPIKGARVVGVSMSTSGRTTCTDERGHAQIPNAPQQTVWIAVSKLGYQAVEHIDITQEKPIVVRFVKD